MERTKIIAAITRNFFDIAPVAEAEPTIHIIPVDHSTPLVTVLVPATKSKRARRVKRPARWWQVLLMIPFAIVIFGLTQMVAPSVVTEVHAPGTFAERLGWNSASVASQTAEYGDELEPARIQARAILDALPGGKDVRVYMKPDISQICGPEAAACSTPGEPVIWIGTATHGQLREILTHEFMHTKTNLAAQAWLRLNTGSFSQVPDYIGPTKAMEGVADCGVQLLIPNWNGQLPYVAGHCTPRQLALAQAVLDGTPLWSAPAS